MEQEILDNYVKAGRIAAEAKREIKPEICQGARLLNLAEKIESLIKEKGGEPAFPVNLSLNDIAAHYTPVKNDPTTLKDDDILKIDLGVHVNGYVCDTAMTVCFNADHNDLIKASENAVDNALKLCRPGTKIKEISDVIEDTIMSFNFKPIANLTGHGLDKFDLHTAPQVPNVKNSTETELEEGMVLAIEPFATTGEGFVKDSGNAMIFSLLAKKTVRSTDARKIIEFSETINNMPFTERWLPLESQVKIRLAMRELVQRGAIHEYPPLREVKGGLVSQAEHTVIVKDKPIITSI